MVMLAVEKLGQRRPVCFAETMLQSAQGCIMQGDNIGAGTRLREAVRRYLVSMCEVYECSPKRRRDNTPTLMAKALLKAGGIDQGIFDWLKDIIQVGNESAHCKRVCTSRVETCIGLLFLICKHSYELEFPTREGGAV